MNAWTSDELIKIGNAEELQIASLRGDGTLRKPVPIWVVRVADDLYIRSWRGESGAWFRSTQLRPNGHIRAGGVDKDVIFVDESDPEINNEVDAAYRIKYGKYGTSYIDPMTSPEVRVTTIKLVPRATSVSLNE